MSEAERREKDTPPDGYCVHGVWVGGMGVDWMCGACESGDSE